MSIPIRRLGPLPLAALVLLAGCASNGRSDRAARPAVGAPVGRTCDYLDAPSDLPALSDLARLALRGNLDLWGYRGDPADSVTLSLRFTPEGGLAWVRPVDATLPVERVVELERLVHASLLEPGPATLDGWGARLRVSGDGEVVMRPSVVCEAELQGRAFGGRVSVQTRGASIRGRRLLRLDLLVSLDEAGRVLDVALRHGSGNPWIDQQALDLARSAVYRSALHDGFGMPSVYRLSLDLRY